MDIKDLNDTFPDSAFQLNSDSSLLQDLQVTEGSKYPKTEIEERESNNYSTF